MTRCFLNANTLGQTFIDNFIVVKSDCRDILMGRWKTGTFRKPRTIIPPCEMVKLRLIMISFIHKEIKDTSEFRRNVDEEFVQSFIGTHIFFYNRSIERWLRMSDFDVVSKSMEHLSSEAPLDTIRDLYSYLENVFVIY